MYNGEKTPRHTPSGGSYLREGLKCLIFHQILDKNNLNLVLIEKSKLFSYFTSVPKVLLLSLSLIQSITFVCNFCE